MKQAITYEDAKRAARDGNVEERCAIASHSETRPEILYYLADDPDAKIRQCIAANARTPSQADLLLARDLDDDVRCQLAEKIGRLYPQTSDEEKTTMRRAVLDVIEVLASDETSRVRAIVSDALKDVADVPHQLAVQLANDPVLQVCMPVLEYSPVLTNEDLVELIQSAPVQGALSAISRRATVDEQVSDAIAASNDRDAITELLANPSAQIREETLDRLIDAAPGVVAWHAPLTKRPKLPASAAQRIASFVTQSLLDTLRKRTDLSPETLAAIETAVEKRMDAGPDATDEDQDDPAWSAPLTKRETASRQKAIDMFKSGELNEQSIRKAITQGDKRFVRTALGLMCGVSDEAVTRIFDQKSGKGIVALCWKAGLDMNVAMQMQFTIGKIAPSSVLKASRSGDFPLSPDEMTWQFELFENITGKQPQPAVQ
jgi:uncharacterized protein (DUF2336 family)